MMILLVGPANREITGDRTARRVFDIGHVPIAIDDLVRALAPASPSKSSLSREVAARLILHCDAVLCAPGADTDVDAIIERARWEGKPVFRHYHDIPALTQPSPTG